MSSYQRLLEKVQQEFDQAVEAAGDVSKSDDYPLLVRITVLNDTLEWLRELREQDTADLREEVNTLNQLNKAMENGRLLGDRLMALNNHLFIVAEQVTGERQTELQLIRQFVSHAAIAVIFSTLAEGTTASSSSFENELALLDQLLSDLKVRPLPDAPPQLIQ